MNGQGSRGRSRAHAVARAGALATGLGPFAIVAACSTLPSTAPAPFDAASAEVTVPDATDVTDATDATVQHDVARDTAPDDVAADVVRYGVGCAAQLAGSPLLEPPGSGFVLVADSRSGFSGTQGSCGWRYGYHAPGGPAFVDMPVYDPALATWFVVPGNAAPWTRIGRDLAHPNGRADDGTPLEHWIIRRWVSDVDGPVAIGVTTHKVDGNAGNGVIVRLVVDGKTIYLQPLARWDTFPRKFVASASVRAGSTVDLVIEAFDGDEAWDTTLALVRVWQ